MTIFQGARPTEAAADGGGGQDLSKLTLAQLRALCAERGISAPSKANKAKLLRLLNR